MHQGTLSVDNTTGAQPGGAFGAFASPPKFSKPYIAILTFAETLK